MGDTDLALVFNQEDADEIYDELRDLHVDLDADPLVFGPKRLNKKVSQVRGMLDQCERVFLDVAQQLHRAKRELRLESTALILAKMYLFANDPETRAGRSVGDREAIATGKLKKEVDSSNCLELLAQDLEAVLVVVKAKRSDLRDTQGRLRDQIRLCQEEIGLGNRWGSKHPDDRRGPDLIPSTVDGSTDIDAMLGGVDGEIHLGIQHGKWGDGADFEPETTEAASEGESEPESIEAVSEGEPEPETTEAVSEGESESEPETTEAVSEGEPEPETSEDSQVDPDEVLPSTSSSDEVDSFLKEPESNPRPSKEQPLPPKSIGLDDSTLNDILFHFENTA